MQAIQISILIVFGISASAEAFGETSNEVADTTDNIVVTASRSPLATSDIGSSSTVITREQIQRQQARFVTDLLRAVPGVTISHSGAVGSQTQVRMRGAEANHVLVLIDGVKANDPASGDEFRWELLSTSNVERIEIVRGPQSSLWGSDALAGVVHIITTSGRQQSKFGAYVEGGSHETVNAGFHAGAGGESWSLGFGLESLDTDGSNISRSGDEHLHHA
jgi:vitamin B12 transporter